MYVSVLWCGFVRDHDSRARRKRSGEDRGKKLYTALNGGGPIPSPAFPFLLVNLGRDSLFPRWFRPVPRSFTIAMTTLCAGTLRPRLIDYVLSVCLLSAVLPPFLGPMSRGLLI